MSLIFLILTMQTQPNLFGWTEEAPQEERESAWRAITAGIRSSVGAISEGLSKVFTDEKGLTAEQVDFLRKSLN